MAALTLTDLQALDPIAFEEVVAVVFRALGYQVEMTKRSGDQGIDLSLVRGNDERAVAQCKRYRGSVGEPAIRDFYGALVHANARRGFFVTTGTFTLAALTWAQGKPLTLIDGADFLAALQNTDARINSLVTSSPMVVQPRCELWKIVESALAHPAAAGRILLDGAPPLGHTYEELARALRLRFRIDLCMHKGAALKRKDEIERWGTLCSRVRIVDEFELLSRAAMDVVLARQRGNGFPIRAGFVLLVTVWEKRLPKAVHSQFATVIRPAELDWTTFCV